MHAPNSSADITAELNVTPLIDVMLVLLVFLLITLPLQTHVVKLDFAPGHAVPQPIVDNVGVQFDGTITWNGHVVSRAQLDSYLSTAAGHDPLDEIHINVDRLAHYDTVAKIMADAQRLGETRIGIVNTNQYVR